MLKKEAKKILIETTKRYLKGAGVGIMSFPQGEERRRIEEAVRIMEKLKPSDNSR